MASCSSHELLSADSRFVYCFISMLAICICPNVFQIVKLSVNASFLAVHTGITERLALSKTLLHCVIFVLQCLVPFTISSRHACSTCKVESKLCLNSSRFSYMRLRRNISNWLLLFFIAVFCFILLHSFF